jgi:hypothetical protein
MTIFRSDRLGYPLRRAFGFFFAAVGLPALVVMAWTMAPDFDPYTQTFFAKQWVEPTPELPGNLRITGWIMIGLGALFVIEPAVYAALGKRALRDMALLIWLGALVAAFGMAFFAAADAAQNRISQEQSA